MRSIVSKYNVPPQIRTLYSLLRLNFRSRLSKLKLDSHCCCQHVLVTLLPTLFATPLGQKIYSSRVVFDYVANRRWQQCWQQCESSSTRVLVKKKYIYIKFKKIHILIEIRGLLDV